MYAVTVPERSYNVSYELGPLTYNPLTNGLKVLHGKKKKKKVLVHK